MAVNFVRPAVAALVVSTALLVLAGAVLLVRTWHTPIGNDITPAAGAAGFIIVIFTYSVAGSVLSLKRPENPIGWLFLAAALSSALDVTYARYLIYTVVENPGSSLPDLAAAGGLAVGAWILPLTATILVLMLFPQGRFASRTWTVVAAATVVLAAIGMLLLCLSPGPLVPPLDSRSNPLGVQGFPDRRLIIYVVPLGLGAAALAATGRLFLRLTDATGDEREQLKWFAYVAFWLPPVVLGYFIANIFGELEGFVYSSLSFAMVAVVSALPIAIGIAILKYRLYDIDLILNRTLVYVPLTAILAGLFTAVTNLLRAVFTDLSGFGSDSSVAISTLAVVALFTPVRGKLQSLVDRTFKDLADPTVPLKALAVEARTVLNVLDSRALMQEFADRSSLAVDATGAAVYVCGQDEPLLRSGAPDKPYVLTFPLHDNEKMLGELKVGASRSGRPYTPEQVHTLDGETDVLARALALYTAGFVPERKSPGPLAEDPDSVSVHSAAP